MPLRRPGSTSLALAVACLLAPTTALAQSRQECADAYVAAQVARREGRLLEARAQLEVCSRATCSATLRQDCQPWLAEVRSEIPALAVKVVDGDGVAVPGAQVTLDGARFDAAGSASVDPGEHLMRVEARGMQPAERRLQLLVGEGRREISVTLARDVAPTPSRRVPVAPVMLGALGLAGVGAFVGLGVAGNGKRADLDALGCKPRCSGDDVRSIKTLYGAADVSLAVGVASLVAGGVLLVVHLARRPSAAGEPWTRVAQALRGAALTHSF